MTESKTQNVLVDDGAYVNFVSQMNTGRDKASYGHFQKNSSLSDYDFEAVYQDWLAKKIINRPVQDMLRAGWYYTGIQESQSIAMADEVKRLKLVERLYKLLKWTRLYGKAYLLIGVADGKHLDQPFQYENMQRGQLQFFSVLKHTQVRDSNAGYLPLEQTMGEPYQPIYYEVSNGSNRGQQLVHSSRLIKLQNGEEGESLLLAIYYTLRNFISTNTSAASLVHESKIDIIRTPNLMDNIKNRVNDVMSRFSAAALLKSINGMLVMDKEEEFQSKTYSFAGLPDLMREFSQQTSAAADIPYTILFGQTTSGLNNSGEFDLRSYYDKIATEQNWLLSPILNMVLGLLYRSLYGQAPVGMGILFNPLWQLDPKTRSEVEKNNAERDLKYIEHGIINEAHVAKQLREDRTYDFIEDEHIEALELLNGGDGESE